MASNKNVNARGGKKGPARKVRTSETTSKKKLPHQRTKLMCKICKAVFDGKHWISFAKMDPAMVDELKINICPACHEKIDHISDGILHLSGKTLSVHKNEIKNIITNANAREEVRDILNRVERIEDNGDELIVYTTKNQLAVEIGKKIASAYKGGKLEIKWSKGDKPVEVKWKNDHIKS